MGCVDEMVSRRVPAVRSRAPAAVTYGESRHDAEPCGAAARIDLEGAIGVLTGVPRLDRVLPSRRDFLQRKQRRRSLRQGQASVF